MEKHLRNWLISSKKTLNMKTVSKEIINKLESEGWIFRQSNLIPSLEFKSPRMSEFDMLLNNLPTEEGFRLEEIECLLEKTEIALDKAFDVVKLDLLNQTKLILSRNQTPPQEFSVSFDIDLTK
jgi:hypothetical protein